MPEGFSPNGDDFNDTYYVEGLTNLYPNFRLEIYDRYGNMVYDYTHNGDRDHDSVRWWTGYSEGRWTIEKSVRVPVGTYFYILHPNKVGAKPKQGWLYINR
jgi:gliding motility-associated-like protein